MANRSLPSLPQAQFDGSGGNSWAKQYPSSGTGLLNEQRFANSPVETAWSREFESAAVSPAIREQQQQEAMLQNCAFTKIFSEK